jgi:hypothetical protein
MMIESRSRFFADPVSFRRQGNGTARRALLAVALSLCLLMTACAASASRGGPDTGPPTCTAQAGATVEDSDRDDAPIKPWQKPDGAELVVEFETGELSARYAGMVANGADIWSKSSCLNAVAVRTCSGDANCVAIEEDSSRSGDTDGEMDWHGDGVHMESATIRLYTQLLDRSTDNGALATVVHEMGHTLGLDHRLERSDVMNSVTTNDTNPVPDAVDFFNLAAIYGS